MSVQDNPEKAPEESTPVSPPAPAPGRALSPAQLEQRRAAARKSTGPKTADGKARSRLNALRHGYFARDAINAFLYGRRQATEFHALLQRLADDLAPVGELEWLLVEEMAVCCVRMRRSLRTECREAWIAEEAARNPKPHIPPALLLAQVKKPDIDALARSVGVGEIAARLADLETAGLDTMLLAPEEELAAILRFERSVKRQFYRALKTLMALQRRRADREALELETKNGRNEASNRD